MCNLHNRLAACHSVLSRLCFQASLSVPLQVLIVRDLVWLCRWFQHQVPTTGILNRKKIHPVLCDSRGFGRWGSLLHHVMYVCVSHSVVSDSVTPWTVAHQAFLSMGFCRQEYWSG